MTTYVIAGGCFWCLDAVYRRLKGVQSVVSGYAGGTIDHPTYTQVSTGITGHAEAVQITFDEKVIPKKDILDLFFLIHDPTTLNRQGNDVGTQYRSAMFYANNSQKKDFEAALERAKSHWDDAPVTTITAAETFYPAEDYHQDYFNKNPGNGYCSIVITPKIVKARAAYTKWFKDNSS
jgi:peptide-methionine (S)-S-oxide reductase